MAKSKHPKKSTTNGEEKVTSYKEMTLEQLESLTENNINNEDIEIDEDMAFNSDDEKLYGRYFSRSSSKDTQRNVSLCVPLQHDTKRIIEVNVGSKLLLSSICLDVTKVEYEQVKLMYKRTHIDEQVSNNLTNDVGNEYVCLGNYLSIKNGGIGLQPSTPMNMQVMGPCKVEFKVEVNPSKYAGGGSINIFGVVVPNTIAGYTLGDDEDDVLKYADAFMSEEEEEEESVVENDVAAESNNNSEDDDVDDKANGKHSSSSKKRKLTDESAEAPAIKSPVIDKQTHAASAKNVQEQNSEKKLTKKQRKKLAKEKAKQLEQTLSNARNEATTGNNSSNNNTNESEEPKKKKKKKQSAEVNEAKWSGTRERRLPGGLVISDIVLGAGTPVKAGKRISLHYTGKLISTGQIFDKNNSKQHPLVFRQGTGEVIRGLERGLEGMKSGGERVITIPSKLGYGSKGSGADIPPDSDLVFEVKVVKVG